MTQASKNDHKICKRGLCNKHIWHHLLLQTDKLYLSVEKKPFVNFILFSVLCLPCFSFTMIWNKNKIGCIWKVYLNYSKCPWKVSILIIQISITDNWVRATRHSAVSAFTETVEFLERSSASMLMTYWMQHDWLFFVFRVCFCIMFRKKCFYCPNLDELCFK